MSLGYTLTRSGFPVIDMPTICASFLTWKRIDVSTIAKSPTTGSKQINQIPGNRYACDFTYPADSKCSSEVGQVEGFLAELVGVSGRFLAYDKSWRNESANNLTLSGALSSGATQLNFTGTNTLELGDWFQIEDGLYTVVEDISGSSITFEPPVVHPVSSGAHIECQNPGVIMRLVDDSQASWQMSSDKREPISFSAVEAKS